MAGALVLELLNAPPELWPGALVLSVVASAVPDLDHTNSTAQSATMAELRNIPGAGGLLGNILKFCLGIVRKILGKREFTHSILMASLLGLGLRFSWPGIPPPMFYAIIAGFLSHPLVDLFNPEGARLFWPFGPKISLARFFPWPFTFKTGSRIERLILRPVLWSASIWVVVTHSLLKT